MFTINLLVCTHILNDSFVTEDFIQKLTVGVEIAKASKKNPIFLWIQCKNIYPRPLAALYGEDESILRQSRHIKQIIKIKCQKQLPRCYEANSNLSEKLTKIHS